MPERSAISLSEALLISLICFGWAIFASTVAVFSGFRIAAFTDDRVIGVIVFELLFGSVALMVLWKRGYSIATLYPPPSIFGAASGLVLYLAAWLVSAILASSMASLVSNDPSADLLKGQHPSAAVVLLLAVVNGSFEEIFLLGYLLRGLRHYGASFALGASVLIRLLYHTYQGPVGAAGVLGYGLVVGLYYLRTSALFPVVFSHILGDIVPFAL